MSLPSAPPLHNDAPISSAPPAPGPADVVAQRLTCPLCMGWFRAPRLLPCCGHACCLVCLELRIGESGTLRCPMCRTESVSPPVSSFPVDLEAVGLLDALTRVAESDSTPCCLCDPEDADGVAVSFCVDCQQFLCHVHHRAHAKTRTTKHHRVLLVEELRACSVQRWTKPQRVGCAVHGAEEELCVYCEECAHPICRRCAELTWHHNHTILLPQDAVVQHRSALDALVEQARTAMEKMEFALQHTEEMKRKVTTRMRAVEHEVDAIIDLHVAALEARRHELQRDVEVIRLGKIGCLEDQEAALREVLASMQRDVENMLADLRQGRDIQALVTKVSVAQRLAELDAGTPPLRPATTDTLEISLEVGALKEAIECLGHIVRPPDLSESHPQARDYTDAHFEWPVRVFGSRGSGDGQFRSVDDVATATDGTLFVTDWDGHSVHVFASDGTFLRRFGCRGFAAGQFVNPVGVTLTHRTEDVLVVDRGNRRVHLFHSDGSFVRSFGSDNVGHPLSFQEPHGVAVDGADNVYVTDRGRHRVVVFTLEGEFVRALESEELHEPSGIAVCSDGIIVVTNFGTDSLAVFTPEGEFVNRFGERGRGHVQFNGPTFVALDGRENIVVADTSNHRIQIVTLDGSYVCGFGFRGRDEGQFTFPKGVAVDVEGSIYVCDCHNSRVQMF